MLSDSARNTPHPDGNTEQITSLESGVLFSPLKLVLSLALGVFVIEIAVMSLLIFLPTLPLQAEILADATLLTLVLVPILYRLLYRPLLQLIADCRYQESQLRSYHEQLEKKVLERTRALKETMHQLDQENAERIRAERILQESEERFHQIFDQSEDAFILISPTDQSIVDANPTAELLFNKDRDSLISGGFSGLCQTTDGNLLESAFADIVTDSRQGHIERFECRTAENDRRMLSFRGKIITLQEAKVVLASFRDITLRVKLEKEAQKVQARLIHANRMTSLGMLVSSVAHEINNPNNFILINSGLIKNAWPDLEQILDDRYRLEGDFKVAQIPWSEARQLLPDAFDSIQEGARRIGGIIENLKEYGRIDRHGLESLVNINEVTRLSASILNYHISRLTDRFHLEMAETMPLIKGSALQLEQVVINLIQNALQALPNRGCGVQVTTGFDPAKNEVFIRIVDEGTGIPKELNSRIMEPFFTTRLDSGGTGLGLAICSAIVKDHGGTLDFSSENGCGSTFSVRLPAAAPSTLTVHTTREANDGNN